MLPSVCAAHSIWGVQKALGVVVSHYRVNLGAISTGYVVPIGVVTPENSIIIKYC
jgi:hypothetical protein